MHSFTFETAPSLNQSGNGFKMSTALAGLRLVKSEMASPRKLYHFFLFLIPLVKSLRTCGERSNFKSNTLLEAIRMLSDGWGFFSNKMTHLTEVILY